MATIESRGHGDKLPRKFSEAILALLTEPSIKSAAAKVDIDESTLRRWMKNPAFQARLKRARDQSFRQGISRLQAATGTASDFLAKLVDDPVALVAEQLKAADLILSHVLKAAELTDIRERLEAVEQQLSDQPSNGRKR